MIAIIINQILSRRMPAEQLLRCSTFLLLITANAVAENYASLTGDIKHLDTQPLVIYLEPVSKKGVVDTIINNPSIISHDNNFEPAFQVVQIGSILEIRNTDPVLHNTHISKNSITLFNVATPLQGQTVKKIISRTGFFKVTCDLHPWMNASLAVIDGPYYSVIWKTGIFKIENIIPGQYQLHSMRADKDEIITSLNLKASDKKHISFNTNNR